MCYSVYLSTDSPEDLSVRRFKGGSFKRLDSDGNDLCTELLESVNQWYVASVSGCSCSFRHLTSVELGFGEPEAWYPEEKQDIDATIALYAVLSSLVSWGHRVDLIDVWSGASPEAIVTIDVYLDDVPASAFRLFENHRFRLKKRTTPVGDRGEG